ncbi:thioredoxin-related transmembrane protein 1-like [Actinia tenebrosa]|uniref:Thioredoxin-related transmembrane protein 1-like n=1 Tax=Actinia tenebrosa TaxID=6105 RepID=A0A6P8HDK0_ACTTE|nr:thioredoxin-related transmembrane protein 1-like [Actinia tenebrosa]
MAAAFWRFSLGTFLFSICLGLSSSASDGKVIELTEDNWKQILEGEWMIKFFAPWCPACQHVAPTWSAFALKGKQLGINVAEVDVTTQSALSGRFMVSSLPTIYHVKDGRFSVYDGSRFLDEFVNFVKEQKWRDNEPVPSWKSPGSFVMGALGILFKLSLFLKDIHEQLTTTYGLPMWASLAIFGVATISAGLILGLVIVYVSDFIFGRPGPPVIPNIPEAKPASKKDEDDIDKELKPEECKENKEAADQPVRKRKPQATTD